MDMKTIVKVAPLAALLAAGCISVNSTDLEERQEALAEITDEAELAELAAATPYADVRAIAVKRITDEKLLKAVMSNGKMEDAVKLVALGKIKDPEFLKKIVLGEGGNERIALRAFKSVTDEKTLGECVLGTKYESVRADGVKRISDEGVLSQVVELADASAATRLAAVRKITKDQKFLLKVVVKSGEDKAIRTAALENLTDEKLLGACVIKCAEPEMQLAAARKIKSEDVSKQVIAKPSVTEAAKLLLLDNVRDQAFCAGLVKERGNGEPLRKKAVGKVSDEKLCAELLRAKPLFEEWVCAHAVQYVKDPALLVDVAVDTAYSAAVRKTSGGKLSSVADFEKVFSRGTDELAAAISFARVSDVFFKTADGQKKALAYFRLVQDGKLLCGLMMKLDDDTELERTADQRRIVKALASQDSDAVRAKCTKILFDAEAINALALEKDGENEKLALWALDLNPGESVLVAVALGSRHVPVQSRAVIRVMNEKNLAKIAAEGASRAVRMSAMLRLTKASEDVLAKLAEDKDKVLSAAAINCLRKLGSARVAALEQKAAERKRQEEEAARLAKEKQAREDAAAEAKLVQDCRKAVGDAQVGSYRGFLGLKKEFGIDPHELTFTGTVKEIGGDGMSVSVGVPCKEGEFAVEAKLATKADETIAAGAYVDVKGVCDGGDEKCAKLNNAAVVAKKEEK